MSVPDASAIREAHIDTCGFPFILVGKVNGSKVEVPFPSVSDAVHYITCLDYHLGKFGGQYQMILLDGTGKKRMDAVRVVTKKGAIEASK